MQALEFWQAVTRDRADVLGQLTRSLAEAGARYCIVGGQAVNAYVEPVVSLDLDLVVSQEDMARLLEHLGGSFKLETFAHSINLSLPGSDLRVQVRTDPRYASFVARAQPRDVLGLKLPVAAVEDVLRGKVWAALDPKRRGSKRLKDLADIARLLEAFPALRTHVPAEVLARLV